MKDFVRGEKVFSKRVRQYLLLLETPEANLGSGKKWLRGACRFDYRHQACGPLCQGPNPAREKVAVAGGRADSDVAAGKPAIGDGA